jgi:preprotein translocase subunit SecB
VREVISDTVVRAGFPPVILSPVNFEAIYRRSASRPRAGGDPPVQIITPTISH